jgi:AP-2 complex subunit alpha
VDTILQLISISGDEVSPPIWHRVIVMVTNNPDGDLQTYVAETMFSVCASKTAHEKAVAIGAYVLGEFGFLIAEEAGRSGDEQFNVLYQHWPLASVATKSIMLTTFAKLANLYGETKPLVEPVFRKLLASSNTELQQRASEYLAIATLLPADLTEDVLREMPKVGPPRERAKRAQSRERAARLFRFRERSANKQQQLPSLGASEAPTISFSWH